MHAYETLVVMPNSQFVCCRISLKEIKTATTTQTALLAGSRMDWITNAL